MCLGIRPEEWVAWFAHAFLGGVVCRGHAQYPGFAPGSSEVALGLFVSFLVFLYLPSRICPKCPCKQLLLVPYSFFVFCCSKTGLSRCKHSCTAAKGPRPQPIHKEVLDEKPDLNKAAELLLLGQSICF